VPLQGFSHVREVLQATETLRHDNFTEVGQFLTVSLVVRYVTEKWFAVALCEIGSDPDPIFTDDVSNMLDPLDDVFDRRISASLQERVEINSLPRSPLFARLREVPRRTCSADELSAVDSCEWSHDESASPTLRFNL
jgi:hypothetical protein